jgi:hypothetical protein
MRVGAASARHRTTRRLHLAASSLDRQQRHVGVYRGSWYEPNASFSHSMQPARSDEFVQLATAKAQQHDRFFDSVQDTPWNLRANLLLSHSHAFLSVLSFRPPLTLDALTSDRNVKRGSGHGARCAPPLTPDRTPGLG